MYNYWNIKLTILDNMAVGVTSLVVLNRVMYCSNSALTLYVLTLLPKFLSFQMKQRVMAVRRASGSTRSSAMSPWSRRSTSPGCRPGWYFCKQWMSLWPTPSFFEQSRSSCWRVPSSTQPCILHIGELVLPILWSLT